MMLLALQVTSPSFGPVGAGVAWPAHDAQSLDGGRRLFSFGVGVASTRSSFKFSKKGRGLCRKSFMMKVPWHTAESCPN